MGDESDSMSRESFLEVAVPRNLCSWLLRPVIEKGLAEIQLVCACVSWIGLKVER